MIQRRSLISLAAAAPAAALASAPAFAASKQKKLKTRQASKIEIVYKTPHAKPNGLDVTDEGLWIIDQGPENYISLVDPASGDLIREFRAENVSRASGLCIDGDVVWVGSTYNRLIVKCSVADGRALAQYQTPGAGIIFARAGDAPGRRTTLEPAYPRPEPAAPAAPRPERPEGFVRGQFPLDVEEAPGGTGAHCILVKGDKLFVDVPPARTIFVIDKNTWEVHDMWPVAGNRPHDMTWADAGKTKFWCSDSNLNAFYLHDASTGEMSEVLQLPDDSPVIHGAKIHNGYMYFCDDVGWMCRFRL